VYSLPLIKASD